ncbi:Beta-glucosidase 3 [Raphanus sativus]|nr:Beta-glucosidase 3 [Raphanus sativus]KAJ4873976.1 Beta-glucosidase 3 [Raphanus sativus]
MDRITIFLLAATLATVRCGCDANYTRYDFPHGFAFGSGTSAYQWEGAFDEDGKKPSVWDTYVHSRNLDNGDIACDGYHKYKEDVQLMVETGLDAFRFSISWSRLIPNGRGPVNSKGLQFYRNFIHELVTHDAKSKPFLPGDSRFFADMGVSLTYAGNFTAFEYEVAPWAMEGKPMKQDLQLQQEDTPRVEFLHAYMGAVLKAVRNGSDTRGYFVWSFMDLYELLSGYKFSFGLYSVNFSHPHRKRSPKLSAHWYSAFLKGKTTFLASQDIMQLCLLHPLPSSFI